MIVREKNYNYAPRGIIDRQNRAIDEARKKGKKMVKFVDCTEDEQKRLLRFYGELFEGFYSIRVINNDYYITLNNMF